MRPTEILMQEHRVIEQVMNCLEIIAEQGEAKEKLDIESANQAIDFFHNFADRCHHGKEEECLFPMLEQKGFSPDEGPTGVMRQEHEAGRRYTNGMSEAIAVVTAGDSQAIGAFASNARAYVQLLRDHIQKEDHCLFSMADRALSEQEQQQVLDSFANVEKNDMGPGTHQKYLDIAAELAKQYDVPCQGSGTCGCGHK